MDALSWFALAIIIVVGLALVYGIIAIHDVPYKIAKKRNHPHADAIEAGGWISLFTLHAIWPFLWIWATLYNPKTGYSGRPLDAAPADDAATENTALRARVAELEARLAAAPARESKS